MKIAISQIKNNPWRNFELYPLDEEQIKQLTKSINDHGFFGGIKARRTENGIELGCGHHRIAACKEVGLKEVDIVVENMDDDQMIRLMCAENATQRGAVAGAVMNEVAAATRRIAMTLLQCNNPQVRGLFPDWNQKSIDIARGHLENGNGVGDAAIQQYLRGARSQPQIRDAVSSLKDSGIYTKILQEIDEELGKEEDEAKQEEEQTKDEQKKEKAKTKTKDKKEAKEKSTKARENSEKKHKRIYDERCASVFATDSQHAAFKRAVTSGSGRKFIAVSQQYELAKTVRAEIDRIVKKHNTRPGAPFIHDYVLSVIRDAISQQRNIDLEEKERLEQENKLQALETRISSMMIHLRSMIKDAVKIRDMLQEDKKLRTSSGKLAVLLDKKDELMTTLNSMWKSAGE